MTKVEAFVCDFCPRKKRFAQAGTARRHELRCFHNPARRACATCIHLCKEPYEPETGAGGLYCAEGLFNTAPGEPEMRSECEGWAEAKPQEGK